jgi:hypothetical protein
MRFTAPRLAAVLAVSAAALAGCGDPDRTADCRQAADWNSTNDCRTSRGHAGGGAPFFGFFGFGGRSVGSQAGAVSRGGFGGTAASLGGEGGGE